MKELDQDDIAEVEPHYKFDFDTMPVMSGLAELHQDGNFLVGLTEGGTRFRQRIPSDKMLSKNAEGNWCLIPLRVN